MGAFTQKKDRLLEPIILFLYKFTFSAIYLNTVCPYNTLIKQINSLKSIKNDNY